MKIDLKQATLWKEAKKNQIIEYANKLKSDEAVPVVDVAADIGTSVSYVSRTVKEINAQIFRKQSGKRLVCVCNPKTRDKWYGKKDQN